MLVVGVAVVMVWGCRAVGEEVRAAVLLPSDPHFEHSLPRVLPVLAAAGEAVARARLLPPDYPILFLPHDDRCDASYGMRSAVTAYTENVHVLFGPTCEYSVASVARLIKLWSYPLLTVGAFTYDFSKNKTDPESEYPVLVRVGHISFAYMAQFVVQIFHKFRWSRVMLIYDKNGYKSVSGKHTCKLMMETLVEFIKPEGIHYGAYDLDKNKKLPLMDNIKNEMSTDFCSEYSFYLRHSKDS